MSNGQLKTEFFVVKRVGEVDRYWDGMDWSDDYEDLRIFEYGEDAVRTSNNLIGARVCYRRRPVTE